MNKRKGFSLIELMIVIAIISIIAALAVPSFENIIRKQKVIGEANRLFSLLYFAKSEAIKRNVVITICKSDNRVECGGTWSDGWIVFVDSNKDGDRSVSETVISMGRIAGDYRLSWTAFGSNNYIRFTDKGLTLGQNGTFKLCPNDGDARFARAVVISKTARVRLSKDSNSDGIYEDASGNALNCV